MSDQKYDDAKETDWIIAGFTECWHPTSDQDYVDARAEFMEWLDKHDAEVERKAKAEALEGAAKQAEVDLEPNTAAGPWIARIVVADWLRMGADEYRREGGE